jgi:sec-independent protein translocase protein TatA
MLVPMFGMGVGELLVVLVVVLLVFGPGRLPEMMGNLGKAMREFQKGLREPPEVEKTPENATPSAEAKREGYSAKD